MIQVHKDKLTERVLTLIEQLNTTYQQSVKNDQQQQAWFWDKWQIV